MDELHIKVLSETGTRVDINGKEYYMPTVPSLNGEDRLLIAVASHLGYEPAHVLNFDWTTIDKEILQEIERAKRRSK